LNTVKALASCICDNVVREVEEFAQPLSRSIKDAVATAKPRQKTVVEWTLTMTAPQTAAFVEEMNRLNSLVASGLLDPNG
jgi:hypothetical protein